MRTGRSGSGHRAVLQARQYSMQPGQSPICSSLGHLSRGIVSISVRYDIGPEASRGAIEGGSARKCHSRREPRIPNLFYVAAILPAIQIPYGAARLRTSGRHWGCCSWAAGADVCHNVSICGNDAAPGMTCSYRFLPITVDHTNQREVWENVGTAQTVVVISFAALVPLKQVDGLPVASKFRSTLQRRDSVSPRQSSTPETRHPPRRTPEWGSTIGYLCSRSKADQGL